MYHFFDLSDFQRFLYDKTHQISDFFQNTLFKIARFARLDLKMRHFRRFSYTVIIVILLSTQTECG